MGTTSDSEAAAHPDEHPSEGRSPSEGQGPSEELAARAAALGALAAGPAPAEVAAGGPTTFVGAPSAPSPGPGGADPGDVPLSAGGAPGFAAGELPVTEVDVVERGHEDAADAGPAPGEHEADEGADDEA